MMATEQGREGAWAQALLGSHWLAPLGYPCQISLQPALLAAIIWNWDQSCPSANTCLYVDSDNQLIDSIGMRVNIFNL